MSNLDKAIAELQRLDQERSLKQGLAEQKKTRAKLSFLISTLDVGDIDEAMFIDYVRRIAERRV